jgi:Protein of unknown function (DUF1565)
MNHNADLFLRKFFLVAILALIGSISLACVSGDRASVGDDDGQDGGDDDTSDDDLNDDSDDDVDDDANDDVDDDFFDDDVDDDADDDIDDDVDDDVDDDADDDVENPTDEIGVFVSTGGDDANSGTKAQPLRSIGAGVELAQSQGKWVFVAHGEYNETVNTPVSLYGGYSESNWSRNYEDFPSTIIADRKAAVNIPAQGHNGVVVIEGFVLIGGILNYISSAVEVFGGEVELIGNLIVGADVITSDSGMAESYGVIVHPGASAFVFGNYIQGGAAGASFLPVSSVGVNVQGEATFYNNLIVSSDTYSIYGDSRAAFVDYQSTAVFINNQIFAGMVTGTSVGVESYQTSYLLMSNNLIFGGAGLVSIGMNLGGEAEFINNIILSGSGLAQAIAINTGQGSQITLQHNDLLSYGVLIETPYLTIYDIDDVNRCTWLQCADSDGNLNAEPLFLSEEDLHLTPGSPCIDAAVNPHPWIDTELVDYDIDGDLRPWGAGWDIGPDEWTP